MNLPTRRDVVAELRAAQEHAREVAKFRHAVPLLIGEDVIAHARQWLDERGWMRVRVQMHRIHGAVR